ncbi:MAG: hypothetical protein ACFB0A_11300 [Croceivirga sp.]
MRAIHFLTAPFPKDKFFKIDFNRDCTLGPRLPKGSSKMTFIGLLTKTGVQLFVMLLAFIEIQNP